MNKKTVLVLCTGNSCRSHMAQGMINFFLGDKWAADSAGIDPAGYVHPLAVASLAELGIDISDHKSQSTEQFRGSSLDWVITVCDDAAENCPIWLGQENTVHIGFPDPAKATGSDNEKMNVFRQVRDDIREQILGFLSNVV